MESVKKAVRTAVMSKQYGNEDFLANLITKACISILPEQTTFNVDNVRVCKILGSGLFSSQTVQGMVFRRQAESNIIKKENCKVAIFTCPVDALQTETKGTVLIKTAEELTNFSRGEETQLENQIKAIADSATDEQVGHPQARPGDRGNSLAQDDSTHCRGAGRADSVYVDELGDTEVVVFQ